MNHDVPWLRSGTGATPAEGGCILQVIDWIDRNKWTDSPPCVHPVIARLAISANDRLPDGERQKLLDLAPRIMGTASDDRVLAVRLALVCAKAALPIREQTHPGDARPRKAIEAAEAWCECPCERHAEEAKAACSAAATAATATATAVAVAAGFAAVAVADAAATATAAVADAAATATYAVYDATATYAAAYAATAATATYAADADALLLAVLDEYDRLTGRTKPRALDLSPVARMLEAARV